jgi:hypothetical protein
MERLPLVKRPGIITFDYLMQPGPEIQNDLKRWLLLYDKFWIPNLNDRFNSWKQLDLEDDRK